VGADKKGCEPITYSFEREVLRTIYGPKIVDGVHRSRYKFELDREFNNPNFIGIVKSNSLHNEHCLGSCRKAGETKEDRNLGGVNSGSRARDWTNFARDRVQ
jgi:hypothetical protein